MIVLDYTTVLPPVQHVCLHDIDWATEVLAASIVENRVRAFPRGAEVEQRRAGWLQHQAEFRPIRCCTGGVDLGHVEDGRSRGQKRTLLDSIDREVVQGPSAFRTDAELNLIYWEVAAWAGRRTVALVVNDIEAVLNLPGRCNAGMWGGQSVI